MKRKRFIQRRTRAQILRNRMIVTLIALGLIGAASVILLQNIQMPEPGISDSGTYHRENSQDHSTKGESEAMAKSEAMTKSEAPQIEIPVAQKEDQNAMDPFYEAQLPLLINANNPIPDDFLPNLADIGNGYQFDKDAMPALQALMRDAKAQGLFLQVISAYRSHSSQTRNFNNKVEEYKSMGFSDEDAYRETALYIAVPGTSEHSVGLAVDLNSIEESFENTAEFLWLYQNCANYGFILRYPKNKVNITGIAYEPWHYRYVGTNHAKEIMSQKICLEEYLAQFSS